MKFGIREVCDCNFFKLPYSDGDNPAFSIDTAKMSTLDSQSSTVYAQGGQGNSRLMAWEGERTLTFTVEDALLTFEAFAALTGRNIEETNNKKTLRLTAKDYAGYYKVVATTFVRNEDGIDLPATITIPRAKLQSALNIPMAPTGEPSSFNFVFDAFPAKGDADKTLCTIEIDTTSLVEDLEVEGIKLALIHNDTVHSLDNILTNKSVAVIQVLNGKVCIDGVEVKVGTTPTVVTCSELTDGISTFTAKILYEGNHYYIETVN